MNATTIDRLHVVERTHFSLSRFIFGKLIGVQSLKETSMFFFNYYAPRYSLFTFVLIQDVKDNGFNCLYLQLSMVKKFCRIQTIVCEIYKLTFAARAFQFLSTPC